jgi:Zn-finger nucleic acid-binding protein
MNCYGCTNGMATNPCACGAAWVPEDQLIGMAQNIKGALVALPWQPRQHLPRPCPTCATPMATVAISNVALDRCATHGIWFDAGELTALLERAAELPAPAIGKVEKLGHFNSSASVADYGIPNAGETLGFLGWLLKAVFKT